MAQYSLFVLSRPFLGSFDHFVSEVLVERCSDNLIRNNHKLVGWVPDRILRIAQIYTKCLLVELLRMVF
jgi:hypothetical protein